MNTIFLHADTVDVRAFEQSGTGAVGITLELRQGRQATQVHLFFNEDADEDTSMKSRILETSGYLHDSSLDLSDIVLDSGDRW